MDDQFLHYERPAPLPLSNRRRMLAAIAVMTFALVPVFMLLLALLAATTNPSKIASYSEDLFDIFPETLLYGLVPGVPLAIVYAVPLGLFARRGWDAIGVSLATGVALGLVLEIAFVAILMPEVGTDMGVRDFFLLLLPFACTGTLMCAIYWRMVIRHRRHARLAAKQNADAIRTME